MDSHSRVLHGTAMLSSISLTFVVFAMVQISGVTLTWPCIWTLVQVVDMIYNKELD